jgi:pheromone shutdown-related protein TraB
MRYKNLILIGTSHIAKQSLEEVENTIKKEKPDIIAIELDKKRYYALTHNVKRKVRLRDIKRIGAKGYLFNVIGAWAEKKLGKYVGVEPGSEMIAAINLAKKEKIKLALIDQDIEITLSRISKEFTWKEKRRLVADIFRGIFFKKRELKKLGIKELDLTKVPSKTLIRKLIKQVKIRYPNFYKVLIEERNQVMANNLQNLMENNSDNKIIAIIGAGHEEEMMDMIKNHQEITYSLTVS